MSNEGFIITRILGRLFKKKKTVSSTRSLSSDGYENDFLEDDLPAEPERASANISTSPVEGADKYVSGPEDADDDTREISNRAWKKVSIHDFEAKEELGRGSYGRVFLAKFIPTGELVALKAVNKKGLVGINQGRGVNFAFMERNVLARCNHPFVLKLHAAFQTEKTAYFAVDYISGGTLAQALQQQRGQVLPPDRAKMYAAEILLALQYLHVRKRVIYRDLKAENVLINEKGHIVLADFGLCKPSGVTGGSVGDSGPEDCVGSPFYMAPEIILRQQHTTAVDIWAFGVLLFRMRYGYFPFNPCPTPWMTQDEWWQALQNMILSEPPMFPSVESCMDLDLEEEENIRDLITLCLRKHANEAFRTHDSNRMWPRIKLHEILEHPYFQDTDFAEVRANAVIPKATPPPSLGRDRGSICSSTSDSAPPLRQRTSPSPPNVAAELKMTPTEGYEAVPLTSEEKRKFRGLSLSPHTVFCLRTISGPVFHQHAHSLSMTPPSSANGSTLHLAPPDPSSSFASSRDRSPNERRHSSDGGESAYHEQ